ncbi:MAG: site-2 protease family protein, partial [Eubacteriales bacterium]|nr:site-2 protease family protein [Eubacteriales bacterium]
IGFVGTVINNSPLRTVQYGYYETLFCGKSIFIGIKRIFTGSGMSEVSGPVGIVSVIGDAVGETKNDFWNGIYYLLYLLMNITISLGVMNLLPIPALDGGRVLITLIEIVSRRKIPAEKEGFIHFIGFGLLIALMIYATYGDILRLLKG